MYYFGHLINRGSVCISPPCFISEKSSWRRAGTMDDLIGGHITLDHMYGRMQEHDPARTNVVWPLLIVNCLVTSLNVTLTCYRDQRFIKVLHETFMGHSRQKDWMCQLLSCMKHQKQKAIDQRILFLCCFGQILFHQPWNVLLRIHIQCVLQTVQEDISLSSIQFMLD